VYFAKLEKEDESPVDAATFEKEFEAFKARLTEAFDGDDRAMMRARMAAVLSSVPRFFNSGEEVRAYVTDSLKACNNNHEKNVSVSNFIKAVGK